MASTPPFFSDVLVPVDFSEGSRLALAYAAELSPPSGRVHVLHAWEIPVYLRPDITAWSGDLEKTLEEQAESHARSAMRALLADSGFAGDPRVSSEIRHGVPYLCILDAAAQRQSNLIIVSTHGRTGLSHLLLGSVAEKIVQLAKCPVLTVRPRPAAP